MSAPRLAPSLAAPALAAPALAALLLSACHIGGGDESWTFTDAAGVDIKLSNGSVSAQPADGGQGVRIDWSGGGIGNKKVHPQPVIQDGVVFLDVRCGEACGGDVTVYLPEGVALSAVVEKGDVSVELPGRADLRACVAAGSVWLEVPAGGWDMVLDVGVGSAHIDGVTNDPNSPDRLEACVAAGDLTIEGR